MATDNRTDEAKAQRKAEKDARREANRAKHKAERDVFMSKPEKKAARAANATTDPPIDLWDLTEITDSIEPGGQEERAIVKHIAEGLTRKDACLLSGVAPSVYQQLLDGCEPAKLRALAAQSQFTRERLQEIKLGESGWQSSCWLTERRNPEWMTPADRAKSLQRDMSPQDFGKAVLSGLATLADKHQGHRRAPADFIGIASAAGLPLGKFHRDIESGFRDLLIQRDNRDPLDKDCVAEAKRLADEFIKEHASETKPVGGFSYREVRKLAGERLQQGRAFMPGDDMRERLRIAEKQIREEIKSGKLRKQDDTFTQPTKKGDR